MNGLLACAVGVVIYAVAIVHSGAALAQAAIEFVVRSPDGQPVANAEVEIAAGLHVFRPEDQRAVREKTDAAGRVHLSWTEGMQRLHVSVKGVGYGSTGRFEVAAGAVARPVLAPLVPFGAIEGVVAEGSRLEESYVEVSKMEDKWKASWNQAGRFIAENLPADEYTLLLQPDRRYVRSATGVAVLPGQRTRTVIVRKDESKPSRQMAMAFGMETRNEKKILWAAGTVLDEACRPVVGADVFAAIGFHGGLRMYERILSVRTDKMGHWEFHGSDSLSCFNGTIIAHKPGHPFASASMVSPIPDSGEENPKPVDLPSYDLVLAARGGNLEVVVREDGRPVEKAVVTIRRNHGPSIYDKHYVGSDRSPNREVLEGLLTPSGMTDSEGIARFSDLVPDEYHVAVAGSQHDGDLLDTPFRDEAKCRFVKVGGVAVAAGKTRKLSVVLSPQRLYPTSILVQRPDGRPYSRSEIRVSDSSDPWFTGAHENSKKGTDRLFFLCGSGLHHIEFTVLDRGWKGQSSEDYLREKATATIGISPLLPEKPGVVLTTTKWHFGSLVVRLEDPSGKPLRGCVLVDRNPFAAIPPFAGSVDEHGEVRFEGIEPAEHTIEAFPAGQTFADLGQDDTPAPADKGLLGRLIVPAQQVTTPDDVETKVVIRAKRAGYVRGKLRPPSGAQPDQCYIACNDWHSVLGFAVRYDTKSGEFLMGPLPEGKTLIYGDRAGRDLADAPKLDVDVSGDHVAQVELVVPEAPKRKGRRGGQQAFLGMGGISMLGAAPNSRGHVFLSDGKTPAYGAAVAYFVPETVPPVGAGEVDALGRIVVGGAWYSGNESKQTPPGSPTAPVLVSWLPGACGAAITPVEKEAEAKDLRIVLPPPLSASGKVTVGGKEVRPGRSQFFVVAQFEGKGKLAKWLSRTVVPDDDGNFTLSALTPGTYRVQAAMDKIWLSSSLRLDVAIGAATKPLLLDIGRPGPGAVVKVVDRKGKPMPGVQATLSRPEGPLADELWPHDFLSDGAGVLHIPPLEVGTHKLQVKGAKERLLTVPPLADVNAIEAEPIVVAE